MKKNQLKELKTKSQTELAKMLFGEKEDLARILIDCNAKKLRNTALVANKKKMIAIISTVIAEKELAKS